MAKQNIFVMGLTDFQRQELQSVADADQYEFHSLLTPYEAVEEHAPFNELLERAHRQLDAFEGSVDAIIGHWDFPTSILVPLLRAERGMPAPSLESLLKCEHKYWARIEQAKVVPENVPAFAAVDPFHPKAADQIDLDYPFWLKPVKAFSSQLGFYVENREQFEKALEETREKIGELGESFDQVLARVDLPPEVQGIGGQHCIAESIISGTQAAPEGYVRNGKVHVHGLFDMVREPNGKSFSHLQYPSQLPERVQQQMVDIAEKILHQVGFDNGCFNVEYLWDEDKDKLWVVEVNTRISQSHSDMFIKVNGMSNHEIAISVALGHEPHFPEDKGRFNIAAKFWINKYGDAEVTRVPTQEEIRAIERQIPGAHIELAVHEGMRLSELPHQDAYRYVLGEAHLGGQSEEDLMQNYQHCLDALHFEFKEDKRPQA
jgi:biotin carboxylase